MACLPAVSCRSLSLDKSQNALKSCLASEEVPHVTRSSPNWHQEITPFNPRLSYIPAVVAIPQSIPQIQAAVLCGVESRFRVTAKAGGHSLGSFGLGGENGHLVIALHQMYRVTLNRDNSANIQPGARLGHIATELYNQGHRAIAHGSCPSVGIAGHVLHGGYGMVSRSHGLTLDWLIGAKVVLANGTLVRCSATENVDLFWALRGAGSSFGIVAEFEFNTFEAPTHITPFRAMLSWNRTYAWEGLEALQKFAFMAPRELNMFLVVGGSRWTIEGMYSGKRDALQAVVHQFLDSIGATTDYMSTRGWIEGLQHFAHGDTFNQTEPYKPLTFYATGLVSHELTHPQLQSFTEELLSRTEEHTSSVLKFHGGDLSAVGKIAPSATAFVHRDKSLVFSFVATGSNGYVKSERLETVKSHRQSITNLMAHGEWGMYPNYIDTEQDGKTAQRLYWGDNLPRLQKLKAELDPGEVFWNPQGVQPLIL
ncbi:hypothetical protein BGZ63DRAFT_350576 [Mariannaea sp. PMI_226]|nr:hypothetical protein BGZ63DRAFT_350576 [Mariannaea sp. PMI_226]